MGRAKEGEEESATATHHVVSNVQAHVRVLDIPRQASRVVTARVSSELSPEDCAEEGRGDRRTLPSRG